MAAFRRAVSRWVLLDGNRIVLATLLVGATFLTFLGLGLADVVAIDDADAVRGVATGFVPGLVAFLSIVLGINQLVLSQEFGSAGEIRERIHDLREYRHDVEDVAGTGPSPVAPIGFLSFVVHTIHAEATKLAETVGPDADPVLRERVEAYAATVEAASDRSSDSLDRLQPGRINALLPVLEYPDSYQLYEARRIQREFGETLPADARNSLDRLVDVLELFSVARTQFRTTYTQRVLARLSRRLLYVGVPALLVVVVLALLSDPVPFTDGTGELVLVSAMLSIAFSPLALLAAYLLRIATVSERTVSAGPFVSRPRAERPEQPAGSMDESNAAETQPDELESDSGSEHSDA